MYLQPYRTKLSTFESSQRARLAEKGKKMEMPAPSKLPLRKKQALHFGRYRS